MGQTVDQAIERVLTRLEGRNRLPFDRLNGAMTTTTETMVCEFGDRNIINGTRVEIDYEILQVYDDGSAPSYSVLREITGGAAAGTLADDSLVRIEPQVYKQDCLEALLELIEDLPDTVYQTTSVDVSFSSGDAKAELTGVTAATEVLWAQAERMPTDTGEASAAIRLTVIESSDSSTGWYVQLPFGATYDSTASLEVTYAHRFDTSTFISGTDLEDTVGVPGSFLSTLHNGVMARITLGEEFQRNQLAAQAQARRNEEVPPGTLMAIHNEYERKFTAGVARESARLRRKYPITETF